MKCLDCKHRSFFPNEICPHCYHFSKYDPKTQTNADKIRAMSDEELADYLEAVSEDGYGGERPMQAEEFLIWLREEVSE